MKNSRTRHPRHLQYETLEPREVMAAGVTAALQNGVLKIFGTDAADQIQLQQTNGYISVSGVSGAWTAKAVKSILVDLKAGDDFVSLASLSNGGNQALKEAVTVKSGSGSETVRLANLQEVDFAGQGHTLFVSATGSVRLNGAGWNLSNSPTVTFRKGLLTITGTNNGDNFALRQTNGYISVSGVSGSWAASKVKSIVIHLQDGNDVVSLDSLANGGNQALNESITVRSGAGSETVHLANGHDVQFSGLGHTLTVAANGTVKLDGQTLTFDAPLPDDPDPPAGNWFDTNIQDAALRSLGSSLYVDGLINRADIMALFQSAQDGGVIDATELADLAAIANNTTLFGSLNHVWKLTTYVVTGNAANARYQGQSLGNLAAGSTATHLGNLVNKWFLGLDRPTTSYTYRPISGTLFVNGVAYTDVRQGFVGDCYLMASLAEVALLNPIAITSMFTVNGDGTYTVRFYNGSQAHYVTVDSYLPTNSAGNLVYASLGANYATSSNELWVGLAEKAYIQMNEMGWIRNQFGGLPGNGQNAYTAIEGGYVYASLGHITGQSTVAFTYTSGSTSFTSFVNAFNQGKAIGFCSYANPASPNLVVGSHAYAVVGYDANAQTVTLFNPWGIQYGLLTLSWSQIQANFQYFDRTA